MKFVSKLIGITCMLCLIVIICVITFLSSINTPVNTPSEVENPTEEQIETIIEYRVKERLVKQVEETLDNRWKEVKDSSNWHEISYNKTVYLIYSGPGKIVDSWPLVEVEEK